MSQIGILDELYLNPNAVPYYPPLAFMSLPATKKLNEEESKEDPSSRTYRYSAQEILKMKNRPECRRRPQIDGSLQFLLTNKPTNRRVPVPPGGKRSYINSKLYTVNEMTNKIEAKKAQEASSGMKWKAVKTETQTILPVHENPSKEMPTIIPMSAQQTSAPAIFTIPLKPQQTPTPTIPIKPRFVPTRPLSATEAMKQLKITTPSSSPSVIQKTTPTQAHATPASRTIKINPLKSRHVPSRPVSAVQAMKQLQQYHPGFPPNLHGTGTSFESWKH